MPAKGKHVENSSPYSMKQKHERGEDDFDVDEEDSWGGVGDVAVPPAKKSRTLKHPSKIAPKETSTLKEAAELISSNSLKTQIDAILPKLKPKKAQVTAVEKLFADIQTVISRIRPVKPEHPLRAAEKLRSSGVSVPYCSPPPSQNAKWKVSYGKPTEIALIGDWANKLTASNRETGGFNVDLALYMPSELFDASDIADARFFHKRAYYLAVVAGAISASDSLGVSVSYQCPSYDSRGVYVVARPTSSDGAKLNVQVHVHAMLAPDSCPFPVSNLSPSNCNITLNSGLDATGTPTPLYNNLLLQALTSSDHVSVIYEYKSSIPSFSDALSLIRLWAYRRGYCRNSKIVIYGFDTVDDDWWSFLLGYLTGGDSSTTDHVKQSKSRLGRNLNSYQLFRGTLDFLSKHSFYANPVVLSVQGDGFTVSDFVANHDATFTNLKASYNFLAAVPEESLAMMRQDAQLTLKALDGDPEPLHAVFLDDLTDAVARFDLIIRVDLQSATHKDLQCNILDFGTRTAALVRSVSDKVRKALGTRVLQSVVTHLPPSPTNILQKLPSPSSIEICLVLNPEEATRLVDHGPRIGEETAIAAFRALWGPKAELRRFKDGTIEECVVWNVPRPEEKGRIPIHVIRHVLDHHFGIPATSVHPLHQLTEGVLNFSPTILSSYPSLANHSFVPASTALDALRLAIKDVEDVPLSLSEMLPVDSYLRQTSVFPPRPLKREGPSQLPPFAAYVPVMEVIIAYETSSAWPEDLAAIQKLKLAFLETIASHLLSSGFLSHAAVVLDDRASVIEDNCALEMVTGSGHAFRARLYCEVERRLLEQYLNAGPGLPLEQHYHAQPDATRSALELHERRFVHQPQHHKAISSLQKRHAHYGPTTRLVKRWLSSHLLAPHIPEETIELLTAYVFVCPGSTTVPASVQSAFAKVMRLLKDWDYKTKPLCIPVYTAMQNESRSGFIFPPNLRRQADASFKARLGEACWSIVTEKDLTGSVFGKVAGPNGAFPARIQQLATATWQWMCGATTHSNSSGVFVHPLDNYDFILHLDPKVQPRYYQAVSVDTNVIASSSLLSLGLPSSSDSRPRVGFDPALGFFEDLRRLYTGTALFFFDPLGGTVIAGVWNPQIRQAAQFSVQAGYSSMPVKDFESRRSAVKLNERAVLAEIERLGSGLIAKITTTSMD